MFLITASILITALVILAASTKMSQPKSDRIYLETSIENKIFENIKEEVAKLAIYSFYDDLNENFLDFLIFVRNYVKAKGFAFNAIQLGIYHKNSDFINISFINAWGEELNVTIKINSTPEQSHIFKINDGEIYNSTFNITIGEDYKITIIFNEYKEDITISTNSTKGYYTYFLDLNMISLLGTRREKYINTIFIT